jgi:hypothetical protein
MKHIESSVKIFFTKDYNLFTLIRGNRQLNKGKIKRISNDIIKGLDVLRYCPILVKEDHGKLDIIDGQHRFAVAKEMKSKVWYIVVEDFTLMDIAKINSNTEKWSTVDFINCYVQQNNPNYTQLNDFLKKTGYPLTITLRLLSKGSVGNNDGGLNNKMAEDFKRGLFQVNCMDAANKMFEVTELFENFPGRSTRPFIMAIDTILQSGKCDFSDLLEKYKEGFVKLQKQETVKAYLANLEEIYNHRIRIRRVIY